MLQLLFAAVWRAADHNTRAGLSQTVAQAEAPTLFEDQLPADKPAAVHQQKATSKQPEASKAADTGKPCSPRLSEPEIQY